MFTKCLIMLSLLIIAGTAAAKEKLIFATEANYPPFVYTDKQNNITGFDIDLINAICAEMRKPCDIQQQAWGVLIPELKKHHIDGIIGAFSITDDRKKDMLFSNPTYLHQTSFIIPTNALPIKIETLLKDKQVGVQDSTIYDQYLTKAGAKKIRFNRYQNIEEALYDLTTGRIEAALGDKEVFKYWLKENLKDEQLQYQLLDIAIESDLQGYAIAINKNNEPLQNAINHALINLKSNGTYQNLLNKYYLQQ